jgi:hypothetical protein
VLLQRPANALLSRYETTAHAGSNRQLGDRETRSPVESHCHLIDTEGVPSSSIGNGFVYKVVIDAEAIRLFSVFLDFAVFYDAYVSGNPIFFLGRLCVFSFDCVRGVEPRYDSIEELFQWNGVAVCLEFSFSSCVLLISRLLPGGSVQFKVGHT